MPAVRDGVYEEGVGACTHVSNVDNEVENSLKIAVCPRPRALALSPHTIKYP